MTPRRLLAAGLVLACAAQLAHAPRRGRLDAAAASGERIEVLTLNVWHGLRGEISWRLPGEEATRRERRIELQLEQLGSIDADLLLLQELNPAGEMARHYASALGYEEIHHVASCGLGVRPLKVPVNISSGVAILARPGLGLKRVRGIRLSGPPACIGDRLGVQLAETRVALLGSIRFAGRSLLVAVVHLHAGTAGGARYRDGLAELARQGVLSPVEHSDLLAALDGHAERRQHETGRLLGEIERHTRSGRYAGLILGGDLNAEPDSAVLSELAAAGLTTHLPMGNGIPLPTWDPQHNVDNVTIGGRPDSVSGPLGLLVARSLEAARPRTIDYLLSAGALSGSQARIVLATPQGRLYPSDHFGVAARLTPIWRRPPSPSGAGASHEQERPSALDSL